MATLSGLVDTLEADFLAYIMNGTALTYTAPATFYIGLSTSNPATDDGATFVEPADTYARQPVAQADWTVSGTAPTQAVNDNDITFPVAGASWGTIRYFGLFDDDLPGGVLLMGGALTVPQAITTGQQVKFSAGDLKITLA